VSLIVFVYFLIWLPVKLEHVMHSLLYHILVIHWNIVSSYCFW